MAWSEGWTILPSLVAGQDCAANGVSADGTVVIGQADDINGNTHAVYWTSSSGIVDLGMPTGAIESKANACSADGSVIVGKLDWDDGYTPLIWVRGTGFIDPGSGLGRSIFAIGISDDGSVVLMIGRVPGEPDNSSYIWTQAGGAMKIPPLAGTTNTQIGAISPDGTHVAGTSFGGPGPVLADNGVVWSATSGTVDCHVQVPPPPFGASAYVERCSNNGVVITVGENNVSGGTAYRFVYSATSSTLLQFGPAAGYTQTVAMGCSLDGSIVCGDAYTPSSADLFLWTEADGYTFIPAPGGYQYPTTALWSPMDSLGTLFVGYMSDAATGNITSAFLYMLPQPHLYGLISTKLGDFPPTFSKFSIALWCCDDVTLTGPNKFTSPSISLSLTPVDASAMFKDAAGNILFHATFHNPSMMANPYHVAFSVDTIAQTYTFYGNGIAWTTSDAAFPNSGQIDNTP